MAHPDCRRCSFGISFTRQINGKRNLKKKKEIVSEWEECKREGRERIEKSLHGQRMESTYVSHCTGSIPCAVGYRAHLTGRLWKSIFYNSLLPSHKIKGLLLKTELVKRKQLLLLSKLAASF